MKRIRTINSAYEEIRKLDPNTAITPYYIRKLVDTGRIRSIRDGSKALVDFDNLILYLNGGIENDEEDHTEG